MTIGIAVMWAVLMAFSVRASEAQPLSAPAGERMAVRLYDTTDTSADERQQATDVASEILASAGILLEWRDCGARHADNSQCDLPVDATQIIVRVVRLRASFGSPKRVSLGNSLVDTGAHAGSLATIYLDRVAWLASGSGVGRSTVAGRAIAHEIGHLLLGSTYHGTEGLMRPTWSGDELARDRSADWRFSQLESARLSEAVCVRRTAVLSGVRNGGYPVACERRDTDISATRGDSRQAR